MGLHYSETKERPLCVNEATSRQVEEVLNAIQGRKEGDLYMYGHSRVLKLDLQRVVKFGALVKRREALAMELIRTATSIPVPRMHYFFEREGLGYIVMDRVEGISLDDLFFQEPPVEAAVVRQIFHEARGYVEQLHALDTDLQHSSSFGQWPDGPYDNVHFLAPPAPQSCQWTFHDFAAYFQKRSERKTLPWAHIESLMAANPAATLCHGDFAGRNFIIADGRVAAVIDWETFGWYPGTWDLSMLKHGTMWHAIAEEELSTDRVVDGLHMLRHIAVHKEAIGC